MNRNSKKAYNVPRAKKRGSQPQRGKRRRKRNAFQRAIRRIRLSILWTMRTSRGKGRPFIIGLFLFLAISFVSFTTYNLTKKNAYAVFVGETEAAIIKMTKEDISPELKKQAILKIEDKLKTNILVNEEISFVSVRANKKEMLSIDEAIQKASQLLTYKVEAFSISVEGTLMAILKSQTEVDNIFDSLKKPYLQEGINIIESSFVEDVSVESIYVDEEEIIDSDRALRILTATFESAAHYTVEKGDNLGIIAEKSGMGLSALLEVNPNINLKSVLRIGDVLNLTLEKPLISVKTVEERKFIEVEPYAVQTLQNPSERSTYRKTVQYGVVGQAEVIQHVIRINGTETEILEAQRNITLEPTPEIVEVGTK